MYILKTHNLVKRYSGRTVVDRVSYTVEEGKIVGLLGRNGAGKTTSFRMTMGMIEPEEGQVIFNGQDVTDLPMYQRAQRGIGYLPQERSVFQRLTCEQNLMAVLETQPLPRAERKERCNRLLEQFDLAKVRKQMPLTLSGGERRKLEIARCLVTDPSLILFDEPFAAVDPIVVEQLQAEIRRLRDEQNISVLITDHNVRQTLAICDYAYIIFEGNVFAEGSPQELIQNEEVKKRYLGQTFRGDEFDDPQEALQEDGQPL